MEEREGATREMEEKEQELSEIEETYFWAVTSEDEYVPDAGKRATDGDDLDTVDDTEARAFEVGYVSFLMMTVMQNVGVNGDRDVVWVLMLINIIQVN